MDFFQHPESHMMSYGYRPDLSEGAVKPPIFQTSTFVFFSAEEGKAYFEVAYGLRDQQEREEPGLIYSRLNNPNLEILEDRLCLWDQADDCAVFESGMSAISTVLLEFLKPGDLLLYSSPCYGGTDHFIHHYLPSVGVHCLGFRPGDTQEQMIAQVEAAGLGHKLAMVYVETPANPTNALVDLRVCRAVADHFATEEKPVYLTVDNTYMGPLWSHPIQLGADLVVYSATKYIGGHSDLIAGAVLGSATLMARVKGLRTFLGNMASPHTCWLLMRSLETLKVRMDQQCRSAQAVAHYLAGHPAVEQVQYLGLLTEADPEYAVYRDQYSAPGAMISFTVPGGEAEAFRLLNALKLVKLAVSLGSTESLVQHPASMTHIGMDPEERLQLGITDNLIRLSVGVEHPYDLTADLEQAFQVMQKDQPLTVSPLGDLG
ncbi:MAG TPA: cystathionine gamma-synthase family protein [Cytophagales bacterium]|nr:cystathionine gamma-synthase family protein [Cytophagales bacterium]